jgi:hypothetical protein
VQAVQILIFVTLAMINIILLEIYHQMDVGLVLLDVKLVIFMERGFNALLA